jgi:soluble lytic murein transglycosylase-like protein
VAEFIKKSKKLCLLVPFFVGLTVFVTSSVSADIYVYKDRSGVLHFTNTPTSLKYASFMPESAKPRVQTNKAGYDDVIAEAARRNGISFHLLKAMVHVESYFNPYAVSKKGALGLMQIMPENLHLLNVNDPFDPWDNIMGGAVYIKAMLERFNGHLDLALAAYNAGPSVVERFNTVPPYRETREYVQKVLQFTRYYQNI